MIVLPTLLDMLDSKNDHHSQLAFTVIESFFKNPHHSAGLGALIVTLCTKFSGKMSNAVAMGLLRILEHICANSFADVVEHLEILTESLINLVKNSKGKVQTRIVTVFKGVFESLFMLTF